MKYQTFLRTVNLIKARLKKVLSHIESLSLDDPLDPVEKQKLIVYQAEVKLKQAEFDKNVRKLLDVSNLPADYAEEALIERQDEISELCVNIEGKIKFLLLKSTPDDDTQSISSHNSDQRDGALSAVRLPKIELKNFNGDPHTWIAFINLFDATIHSNNSLPAVAKFQYLIGTLSGEALNLIKSLPLSDANYLIAYNTLRERYHSVRRLSTLHMNKIFELPNVSFVAATNLRSFINTFNENTQALKALGCDILENNPLLANLILRKLDSKLLNKYESSRTDSQSLPTVSEIVKFLAAQCAHAEDASMHSSDTSSKVNKFNFQAPQPLHTKLGNIKSSLSRPVSFVSTKGTKSTEFPCFACSQPGHRIYFCSVFKNKSPQDRYQIVKSKHRCFSCLGNHDIRNCKSKYSCVKCQKKHHTLLHVDFQAKEPSNSTAAASTPPALNTGESTFAGVSTNFSQPQQNSTVLLATVLVKLVTKNGNSQVFRGLVDSCSQCDFISERAAQLLGVERHKSTLYVNGVAQALTSSKGVSHLSIETVHGDTISDNHPMWILDRITSELPKLPLCPEVLQMVRSYNLADPHFYHPGPIDVLLGGGLFPFIFSGEKHHLGPGLPFIMNTVFGYTLMGHAPTVDTTHSQTSSHSTTLLTVTDLDLHNLMQRFWQQEEPPRHLKVTPDELLCENHFVTTHSRDSTGRYCVRLPFQPDHPPLGDSMNSAKQRFLVLENRFKRQPEFKTAYVEFMSDYLNSGHMKHCDTTLYKATGHYFLPHHGVLKASSSTTKLRTVFDASSKTSTDVSLNDVLLTGMKLQVNIFDIIFHFRRHNVVFTCDIRQMYRQIRLHPDDQRFQLIFWRNDSTQPLTTFQLETVTFGLNCSPFLALRTLRQLAEDERKDFPEASDILQNYTYVDDVIGGHEDEEKAKNLQTQLIKLLEKGGFDLRKWISNSPNLLGSLPSNHHEVPRFLHTSDQPFFSILGLYWSASLDVFSFHFQLEKPSQWTKRSILSVIAKISYDPCGFISPITMWAKVYMQLLWTKGFDWDEPLPPEIVESWDSFMSQLHLLSELKIPRPFTLGLLTDIQVHGFSDASESGFSAVVYIRCLIDNTCVKTHQLISKTRVAPLKKVSLPRLELCGSHLLAKLIAHCLSLFSPHYSISHTYAWCDSTIVLSWIQTPPYRLNTYVANRVSEIQELVPSHSWSHVNTNHNPADCASRGILPEALIQHPLWWTGPPWLSDHSSSWPVSNFTPIKEENLEETKPQGLTVLVATPKESFLLFDKFSSWSKLLRVCSYMLRFIKALSHKDHEKGPLTVTELKDGTSRLYELIQKDCFSDEINLIKQGKPCSTRIQRLSPFLDEKGLLRVGGRLRNSTLTYGIKHPIILPKNHRAVNMLVDHYHLKYLHSPPQLLQSILSQEVWILSARSLVRSRVHQCIKCFRSKPRNKTPLMGDLPEPRVTPSRPFFETGVDFCGPFPAKAHNLRSLRLFKLYICIFVCFSTKAVHFETVTDLSSNAFIAALSRFISRRGLPNNIYCDNGTNFIGANTILKTNVSAFLKTTKNRQQISDFASQQSINFHFNPPAAPHQGGLWEAAVKSMKYHLKRVVGESVLTIEEYNTLVAKIESILNSRPLTPMSTDPADISALTPGHFLIGTALTAVPEEDYKDIQFNKLKRWQRLQAFTQHIWHRWSRDYLHTLQARGKWDKQTPSLQINDLVIVQDSRTPPLQWPLARIVEVHPGCDNTVRVVTLRTKNGTLTRPAVKVFPLPVASNSQ